MGNDMEINGLAIYLETYKSFRKGFNTAITMWPSRVFLICSSMTKALAHLCLRIQIEIWKHYGPDQRGQSKIVTYGMSGILQCLFLVHGGRFYLGEIGIEKSLSSVLMMGLLPLCGSIDY
jgi:hypothetical protein